jgi:hypothetical protein
MKAKNFVLLFLCIAICSCEGDAIDPDKAGRSLQLQAEIDGSKTRVSNSSWEKNDAIGVYMAKAGQALSSSALRQNIKYATSGSSAFVPADETQEISLPFDGSNVDFIGYYPYRNDIAGFSYPIDLSDQSAQAAVDLMYSNNAKNFNSKNPNVRMQFTHQLSKIVLNIKRGESIDLSNLSAVITNAGTQATFDLITGELSETSKRGDIRFKMSRDGSVAEAILLPETNLSGMDLWFIIGEGAEAYKFSLANTIEINTFEKSTRYVYNVTLFSEKITAIAESTITNWIEGPSVNANADRSTNPPSFSSKGSKENPYTVAEAQTNQEKTDVWVKGFIVGSFKNTINGFVPGAAADASATNIALADAPGETNTGKMIPVQLPSGAIRNALNIPDNSDLINKTVIIKGNLGNYFSAPGLRDPKEYVLISPEE